MKNGEQIKVSTGIMTVKSITKRGGKTFVLVSYKSEVSPIYDQETLELSEDQYNQLKKSYFNK